MKPVLCMESVKIIFRISLSGQFFYSTTGKATFYTRRCDSCMWSYQVELPGGATRWSYQVELPGGATRWSYQVELPGGAIRWSYQGSRTFAQ